jgi:hypothetical protein
MLKNNIDIQSALLNESLSNIHFFGLNTLRYVLSKYQFQFDVTGGQLYKNKNKTLMEIVTLLEYQTMLYRKIQALRSELCDAECKPPLAQCRHYDWFMIGERVVCFVRDSEKLFVSGILYNNRNILYDGRRAISVVYDRNNPRNCFLGGYGGLYGISSPFVLKSWEFKYLRNHLDFAHLWIRYCIQTDYSFENAIQFSRALQ